MKFQFNDGGRKSAGYQVVAGDCVCRAIAIVTGKLYQDVYSDLNNMCKGMRQTKRVRGSSSRDGVNKAVYRKYLNLLGWKWIPTMFVGQGCKVHLVEEELPGGRLIVSVSKHMTSVIDHVLNDTYDCSREGTRCVYGYWVR